MLFPPPFFSHLFNPFPIRPPRSLAFRPPELPPFLLSDLSVTIHTCNRMNQFQLNQDLAFRERVKRLEFLCRVTLLLTREATAVQIQSHNSANRRIQSCSFTSPSSLTALLHPMITSSSTCCVCPFTSVAFFGSFRSFCGSGTDCCREESLQL